MKLAIGCQILIILALASAAQAQASLEIDFGVRTGMPFTTGFESNLSGAAAAFSSQAFSRPVASVGPTISAVLHERISVQFDVLYKRTTMNSSAYNGTSYTSTTQTLSSWEFPVTADYAFLSGPMRPFAGGGIVLGETFSGGFSTSQLPAYVINGGLEWRLSRVVLRPELRYTRWNNVSQSTAAGRRENQFEYLIGFSFRSFRR